jgi:hypothetical protein
MRPPLSAIDPASAGVSILMRGERASASVRPIGPVAALGSVPATGAAGPPSFGLGEGTPSGVTPGLCWAAWFWMLAWRCCSTRGAATK